MALRPALGTMHRQLRRGPSVSAGGLVLTPVVVHERGAGVIGCGCWIVAATRPVAVIVTGPNGRRLVRLADVTKEQRN